MSAIPKGKRVVLSRNQTPRLAQTNPKRDDRIDSLLHDKVSTNLKSSFDENFHQIVVEHQQSVRVFLARYVFCSQQIDDLAQEVFIVAYRQLRHFRQESTLSTWLLGIARNKALGFLRSEVTQLRNRKQFAEAKLVGLSLESLDQEFDSMKNHERLIALSECLELLPPQSRQLVHRFYFRNEKASVIATVTQQKDGTVRMKLKRIREVLHKCIASKLH